jgi:hypothetical protein
LPTEAGGAAVKREGAGLRDRLQEVVYVYPDERGLCNGTSKQPVSVTRDFVLRPALDPALWCPNPKEKP